MASRNERRRKARQRAQVTRAESSHGDIEGRVGATLIKSAERISKAAESRQPKTEKDSEWDPERHIAPPIPPTQLWSIFETNPYHSGAINAKVADAVGRGWKLTPEDDEQEGVEDDVKQVTRELTDLLEEVCPKLTFRQLCEQATRELDAIGWGVWEILRDRDGDVDSDIVGVLPASSLDIRACKHSDDVFCLRRGNVKVYFKRFGFEKQVDAKTGDIEGEKDAVVADDRRANELVIFQHYSPRSSYYGIPPWVAGVPATAEFSAIREFNVSFFESGGQADRLIHVAAKDDGVASELSEEIVKQMEDARGEAHVSIVTHGDETTEVTVTPLEPKANMQTGSSRDASFRGGKTDVIQEIITAHGVPPYRVMIAATGSLGGDTSDSMDDDYRIGSVEPLQEILEAELRRTIFGDKGFADALSGWKFEFEDRTQDDTQDEHARLMDDAGSGVKSPNDVREAKGDDRVEDPAMDRYYIKGQPISTDPAVTDVATLLAELRDALTTAAQAGEKPSPNADEEDDLETAPEQVAASERVVGRGWQIWRRR